MLKNSSFWKKSKKAGQKQGALRWKTLERLAMAGGITMMISNEMEKKIEKMKSYNLVVDTQIISWKYLREKADRIETLIVGQDKLCGEFIDFLKDILKTVSEEEREFVEKEVYTYVLKMACAMCESGKKLLADYSGFQELFDLGNDLVKKGHLKAPVFLNQMLEQDQPYTIIAGLQGLHSSRIKDVLDENVICNNREYQALTKQLAQEFNEMWLKFIKRNIDFRRGPGEAYIDSNWEIYSTLLKGLPISVIDTIDESAWELTLDYWEKKFNGEQYKQNFIARRDQERNTKRKEEQEAADKRYWEKHPQEYQQLEANKQKIAVLLSEVETVDKEMCALENDRKTLKEERERLEKAISDNKHKIEKLEQKIFGKKKAKEKIKVIAEEIEMENQELQRSREEMGNIDKLLFVKEHEKANLQRNIEKLEQENTYLRQR